jgi:hypothetical protein
MIHKAQFERKRALAIENLEAALEFLKALHPMIGPGDFFEQRGDEFKKVYDPYGLREKRGRTVGHVYEKGEVILRKLIEELSDPEGFKTTMAVAVSILSRTEGPVDTIRKAVEVYKVAFRTDDGFDLFPSPGGKSRTGRKPGYSKAG